jgi:signal transduction histidine kinase
MTAVALAALAALAFGGTVQHNVEIRRRVQEEVRGELREHVAAWQLDVVRRVDAMLTEVEAHVDAPDRAEDRVRRRERWLDSVYIWGGPAGLPLWPSPAPSRTLDDPTGCMALPLQSAEPPACASAPDDVRVERSVVAARDLLTRRDAEAAVVRVEPVVSGERPLDALTTHPRLLLATARARLLLGEARIASGAVEKGLEELQRLVDDVLRLDAPALEGALLLAEAAETMLAAHGVEAAAIDRQHERAEGRVLAWRKVSEIANSPPAAGATPGPRFEPLVDTGSALQVLYWRPSSRERPGIALLLDGHELAASFIRSENGRLRDVLAVLDAEGVRHAGVDTPPRDDLAVELSPTAPGLSVVPAATWVEAHVRPLQDQWLSLRSVVTLLSVVLGFGALWAFYQTDREHEKLIERQKEFTTRVTHELKTPVAGIKVMAENLSMGAWRDERHRAEMTDRIVQESDRLTARINEILAFARAPSPDRREPVDIEELVFDAIDTWGPRMESAGITFRADVDVADPVQGDPVALRDAIACLLDNAIKYRREEVASEVWLNVRMEGRAVQIEVVDNGLGVPADKRQAIFDRFVRVEGPNRGRSGGHGLGLAQVALIAKAHRGRAYCDAGNDGGARFVLELPATPAT